MKANKKYFSTHKQTQKTSEKVIVMLF